jgi:hypothetical protein
LQGSAPEEHPRCGRQNNVFCVDAVTETPSRRPNGQHVAESNPVELEEGVRVRDAVPGNRDRAGLAREARTGVMTGALRKDPLRSSLVKRNVFVQPRDSQNPQAGSRRRVCGGSGMGGCCKSSNSHEAYGVNASCPEDTLFPRTAPLTWLGVLVGVLLGGAVVCVGGDPKTPEFGGELTTGAVLVPGVVVLVPAVVVTPVVVVVVGARSVVVPFVVGVSSVVVVARQ